MTDKKKIEIIESSQRIAKKRVERFKEKFKDLNIWIDGLGHTNISKNGEYIMSISGNTILLHNEKYLPTAKDIAEFLGLDRIELQ